MKSLTKSSTNDRMVGGRSILKSMPLLAVITTMVFSFSGQAKKLEDGGLRIGWAMEDITPVAPASLNGQYYERISTNVQSPLKATACAIESTDEKGSKDQAIMLSLDIINIGKELQDTLRAALRSQLPDFDSQKLIVNGTHTHSAPNPNIASEAAYRKIVCDQGAKAAVAAWKNRKPAGISRHLGYAVVGHNRLVEYSNGTAEMYGRTDRDDFTGIEGASNPGVDMLFCWDLKKKLTGIIMNVSCPAQVTESKYYVSADYWGEVRKEIKKRFPGNVYVFPQCGAAGDISPRDLPHAYKAGEPNMWDVAGIVEIGKRLGHVIDDAYPIAKDSVQTKVPFKHTVKTFDIPTRRVSKEERDKAQKIVDEILSREPKDTNSPQTAWNRFFKELKDNEKTMEFGPWDSKTTDWGWLKPMQRVVKQYENQDKDTVYKTEVHAIRLGDVAFATNPFELFVDYGFSIIGRSKARQTFVVQLCGDNDGRIPDYLPTEKALPGGGYSAMANHVGPPGGRIFVNETVKMVNGLWE